MVGRRCGPGRSTASPFGPVDAQAAREITIKREKKARNAGLGIEGFTVLCRSLASSGPHGAEPGDSLLDGRVGREELKQRLSAEGVHNKQV